MQLKVRKPWKLHNFDLYHMKRLETQISLELTQLLDDKANNAQKEKSLYRLSL